jgi:cell wall-associated NlpC family hydrolase
VTDDWRDLSVDAMTLVGDLAKAGLRDALSAPPTLERTIDGASQVQVQVQDARRTLLRSGMLNHPSWLKVDGHAYELAAVTKSGPVLTLTFEDAIAAAMSKPKGLLTVAARRMTRADFLARLAATAHVKATVDPALDRVRARNPLTRDKGEDSWVAAGRIADEVQARRFSDGARMVVGGDKWLIGRQPLVALREGHGGVDTIDFDYDVGAPAASATVTAWATRWAIPPGLGVTLSDLGPANGPWLVQTVGRPLTSRLTTIALIKRQAVLPEPKAETTDTGEKGLVPGRDTVDDTGGKAHSASAEKMVRAALRRSKGRAYQMGGHGPGSYDCSGLVDESAGDAGASFNAPAASQWAACQHAGTTISVAQALKTRGALLFRINNGPFNHVAISLGNGQTVEAMGTAYGCGVFGGAAGRTWTGGGIVPGM